MGFKDIFVWMVIFVVGSLIVSFLIYPDSFDSFKNNMKDISTKVGSNSENNFQYSIVNVVENPENYVEKDLKLDNTYICYGEKIVVYKEDGVAVNLPYEYKNDLNPYYKFDFYGTIETNLPKSGIVSVDDNGNMIGIKYWFKVERAIQKERIDLSKEHVDIFNCGEQLKLSEF